MSAPSNSSCPLVQLISAQVGGDDYTQCYDKFRVFERIDEIAENMGVPVETPEDRSALVEVLTPLYEPFAAYVGPPNHGRHGRDPTMMDWFALHEFLKEHGFTAASVAKFIEIDTESHDTFSEVRWEGSTFLWGRHNCNGPNRSFNLRLMRYNY